MTDIYITEEREIKVRELSLAAFIKTHNLILKRVDNGEFIFDSKLSLSEWKMEFLKSESCKFDREVRDLRWILKNK